MRRIVEFRNLPFLIGLAVALVFQACSKRTSPEILAKTAPGVYAGTELGFREALDLKPNGEFNHEVFVDGVLQVTEVGKWSFDAELCAIRVEPFTSFFDVHSKKVLRSGVKSNARVFFVMQYDDETRTLSPSIDFEFRLLKTKSYATDNGTNNLAKPKH